MERSEKVYVLLLNWNNWKDTVNCIQSLLRMKYRNFQIIVVDNNSTDNSVAKILDLCHGKMVADLSIPYIIMQEDEVMQYKGWVNPVKDEIFDRGVILIRNRSNYGFGKGNNTGLRFFLNQNDAKYVWLLNVDTEVHADALYYLVEDMSATSEEIGAIGSVVFYHNNPATIQTIGGGKFFPMLGQSKLIGKGRDISYLSQNSRSFFSEKLSYIMGVSMLMSYEVLQKVKGFDEDFFVYAEEVDLCYRIVKSGYKLSVSLDSFIYHKDASSTKERKYFYYYLLTKGNMIFLKKHFSLVFRFSSLVPILLNTIKHTRRGKDIRYALKGYFEGLNFKTNAVKN